MWFVVHLIVTDTYATHDMCGILTWVGEMETLLLVITYTY